MLALVWRSRHDCLQTCVQKTQGGTVVRLPFDLFFVAGPVGIGFAALLFVLPAWASLKTVTPSMKQMASLLGRYAIGLAGGCFASLLVLVGGWSYIEIKVLLVLTILWSALVLFFGLGVNIVLMTVWIEVRYFLRDILTDVIWAMYSIGAGIIAVLGIFAVGLTIFVSGEVLIGVGIVLGVVVGLFVYVLVAGKSNISGSDQYAIFIFGPLIYRCDGMDFRLLAPVMGSGSFVLICCVPASVLLLSVYFLRNKVLPTKDDFVTLVILGIVGCAVLLVLGWRLSKRLNKAKCHKIYALYDCLVLLERAIRPPESKIVERIVAEFDIGSKATRSCRKDILTTDTVYELAVLVSKDNSHCALDWPLRWVTACQTDNGFGLWPGSTARLCSTYQGLSIFQKYDVLASFRSDECVSWIRSLQQPNGTFKGPWSKRPAWEDTFFAVVSLDMLGASLDDKQRERTLAWARETLINDGIEKDRPDVIYYCLAVIDILGNTDTQVIKRVDSWLSEEIDKLLLTNISHTCDAIHFALKTRQILIRPRKSKNTQTI